MQLIFWYWLCILRLCSFTIKFYGSIFRIFNVGSYLQTEIVLFLLVCLLFPSCLNTLARLIEMCWISSVQSLSCVRLFATPAHQASLSITISRSSLRLTSIESVMPSSHLILCRPLLLLPPIPPSIKVFSNESTHRMRWPKYWSFSFSIIPSKEHPGLISTP